ncbi:MAG TPA: hypothetical protein VEJ63_13980 [Planctomycetota bacterium]|nr:hypothetical protein [Planctomycetota bacterium]
MNDTDEFHLKKSEIMIATGGFRANALANVTEGSLAIRELCFRGVSPAIPAGESAIKALTVGKEDRVYGVTSGRQSHLFMYDPHPVADHVVDLGVIEGTKDVCAQLVTTDTGLIVGGSRTDGRLFSYCSDGDFSLLWKNEHNKVRLHDAPVTNNAIHALCFSKSMRRVFGLASPSGTLFSFEPEYGRIETHATLPGEHLSRVLAEDDAGLIWGAERHGWLYTYDPKSGKLERPGLRLPSGSGLDYVNEWDAATPCREGLLFGGTVGGYVFSLDTAKRSLRTYGKPIAQPRIRALTRGRDGTIFGLAGRVGDATHLFRFSPATGEMKDLGVPLVSYPKIWTGYEFDAMLTGRNGEIMLGESDRVSHLFLYYPAVR